MLGPFAAAGQVELSVQLQADDGINSPALTMACSPLYDKMVVGSSDGR